MRMRIQMGAVGAAAAALLMAVSCNGGGAEVQYADFQREITIGSSVVEMADVPGVSFAMGTTADGRLVSGAGGIYEAILDGYAISTEPVSQALWAEIMGGKAENPSAPATKAAYDECQKFLRKLSSKTGIPFTLPTEAQWSYAVREGSVTTVKGLKEWCLDYYTDEVPSAVETNPCVDEKAQDAVVRTATTREPLATYTKSPAVGFRLAYRTPQAVDSAILHAILWKDAPVKKDEVKWGKFNAGEVEFEIVPVAGGTFKMGGTPEQYTYPAPDEYPVHDVTVESFGIGKDEVTIALWQAVMGSVPYGNSVKEPAKPVVNVSWYDAQRFILKLNALTGRTFRLPTEAEWEFAALGGLKSRSCRYAGSNDVNDVAVYTKSNSQKIRKVEKVRTLAPNELGIYDMSGNAWEWCQNAPYEYGTEYVELGAETRAMRGGSAASQWDACRVSNRSSLQPSLVKSTFGFRLAL